MKIEIISGSPRANSITKRIALHLQKHLSANTEHEVGLIDVREWNLGLLDQVFSSVENTPDQFKPLAKRVFGADAFILVTPEYNGGYSPALQNLLDHFPKQSRNAFGLVLVHGCFSGMRVSAIVVAGASFVWHASPHMLIPADGQEVR